MNHGDGVRLTRRAVTQAAWVGRSGEMSLRDRDSARPANAVIAAVIAALDPILELDPVLSDHLGRGTGVGHRDQCR